MVLYRSSARIRSRSAPVVSLLLLTLGLAGVMAYQAWDATRSHQKIAEEALWDHTRSAAWLLASAIRTQFFLYHTKPGLDLVAESGGMSPDIPLKGMDFFNKVGKEHNWPFSNDPANMGSGLDFVFRFDLASGKIEFHGNHAPSDDVAQWLRNHLKEAVAKGVEGREKVSPAMVFHGSGAGERAVVFAVHEPGDRPETAFGFQTDLTPLKAILSEIGKEIPLIPPALTKGKVNEHLLSYTVRTPSGRALYQSQPQYSPKFEASESTGEPFGDLTASVVLNPEAAEILVIGGLPKSRLPTILGLLALTSAMVLVAIFQLRREQELALLRTDFVSSVSHQLRTPLAQIRMFGETLLLGRVRNEEEAQRSLEIIVKEAQSLTHQVDNVLQFSRAERGEMSLALETIHLAPLVAEVLEGFCPLAEAEGCRVEASLDETMVARVDPGAVRQVLVNLLENAVKYGPSGQIVDVRLRKGAAGTVQLLVEDEGEGIPEDQRFDIFTPYSRLERDRDSGVAGSGIGLAVVQELVKGQGGTVRVEEAVSGGARFVVSFPRED